MKDVVIPPWEEPLLGRYHPRAGSTIYGHGGARKGTIVAGDIVSLCKLGRRVLLYDAEDNADEWKRRLTSLGGGEFTDNGVWYFSPNSPDYEGPQGSLWDLLPDIRRMVDKFEATDMVVDSIQTAVTGDVSTGDTEIPRKYHHALRQIGIPTLSLAHTPKHITNMDYPFGSQGWQTNPRNTWSAEEHGDGLTLFTNRKRNDGARIPPQLVEVTYGASPQGLPINIEFKNYRNTRTDQLIRMLATRHDGTATTAQLEETFNEQIGEGETRIKRQTINTSFARVAQRDPHRLRKVVVAGTPDRWMIPETEE